MARLLYYHHYVAVWQFLFIAIWIPDTKKSGIQMVTVLHNVRNIHLKHITQFTSGQDKLYFSLLDRAKPGLYPNYPSKTFYICFAIPETTSPPSSIHLPNHNNTTIMHLSIFTQNNLAMQPLKQDAASSFWLTSSKTVRLKKRVCIVPVHIYAMEYWQLMTTYLFVLTRPK